MIGPISELSPFRHRIFASLWIANLTSNFGSMIQTVAAAWLMTSISPSADMVALVQSFAALPIVALALVSGAWADSFDRRKIMFLAQALMFIASAALASMSALGMITPELLLALVFIVGAGTALHNPSWLASIGDMVPRAELPAAVALSAVGNHTARTAGPAAGGAIVATLGAPVAFAVNVVSYIPLLLVLATWKRVPAPAGMPREELAAAIVAGLRYASMSPVMGKVLVRSFAFGFAGVSVLALLPLVARDKLGGNALLYGILFGSFGVGAVGGGFLGGVARRWISPEWIVRLSFATLAGCACLLALGTLPWLAAAGLVVGGASWILALSLFNILLQISTPRWVVGRALALYNMAAFGGMAAGSWIWGLTAARHGTDVALGAAAISGVVGAAMGLTRLRLPAYGVPNLDPLHRGEMPQLELELTHRSGPVRITVEYVIASDRLKEFVTLMAERKRIRRRDGARQWTLLRDTQKSDCWIESYQFPTWAEHIRFVQRATQDDASIGMRLRALHSGDTPPVRRYLLENPISLNGSVAPDIPGSPG